MRLDAKKDDQVISTTRLYEVPLSYNKKVKEIEKQDRQ
jgi:hypothetical protein